MMTPFRFFASFAATVFLLSLASDANAQGNIPAGSLPSLNSLSSPSGLTSTPGNGATAGAGGIGGTTAAGGAAAVSTLGSNATETFIGSNATQGFIGGATGNTTQQRTNRQFQALQNDNQQQTQQATGTPRAIKTTLRVGFAFPSAPQLTSLGRMANANVPTMNRFIPQRPELAGISVDVNPGGVAVLTGSASSEETSRLAANLMRIQPGVRKVDNQVVVRVE